MKPHTLPCGCLDTGERIVTPCPAVDSLTAHLERAADRLRRTPTRANRREYLTVLADLDAHLDGEAEAA